MPSSATIATPIGRPTTRTGARSRQPTAGARPGTRAGAARRAMSTSTARLASATTSVETPAPVGPKRRDRPQPVHEHEIAQRVERQHRRRDLEEDPRPFRRRQDGAVEHHAEHRDERQAPWRGCSPARRPEGRESRPSTPSQSGAVQTIGTRTTARPSTMICPVRSSRARSAGSAPRDRGSVERRDAADRAGAEVEEYRVEVAANRDGGERLGPEGGRDHQRVGHAEPHVDECDQHDRNCESAEGRRPRRERGRGAPA
jgi:hypothetical protein